MFPSGGSKPHFRLFEMQFRELKLESGREAVSARAAVPHSLPVPNSGVMTP